MLSGTKSCQEDLQKKFRAFLSIENPEDIEESDIDIILTLSNQLCKKLNGTDILFHEDYPDYRITFSIGCKLPFAYQEMNSGLMADKVIEKKF